MLTAGLGGMNGFGSSEMDNFEYFDAALVPAVGAAPRIGERYALRLDTPTPNVPWISVLSLGNAGIPIGNRAIPLSLDPLFSIWIGVAGALGLDGVTDNSGRVFRKSSGRNAQ